MKASELIESLIALIIEHGDKEIYSDSRGEQDLYCAINYPEHRKGKCDPKLITHFDEGFYV